MIEVRCSGLHTATCPLMRQDIRKVQSNHVNMDVEGAVRIKRVENKGFLSPGTKQTVGNNDVSASVLRGCPESVV